MFLFFNFTCFVLPLILFLFAKIAQNMLKAKYFAYKQQMFKLFSPYVFSDISSPAHIT